MSVSRSIEKVAGDLYASVDTFLNDVTSDVSECRSSPRVKTQEAVVVLSNGRLVPTQMRDVSETGVRIDTIEGLALGTHVSLEGRAARAPAPRWCVWARASRR
jgi:hypothetical protein